MSFPFPSAGAKGSSVQGGIWDEPRFPQWWQVAVNVAAADLWPQWFCDSEDRAGGVWGVNGLEMHPSRGTRCSVCRERCRHPLFSSQASESSALVGFICHERKGGRIIRSCRNTEDKEGRGERKKKIQASTWEKGMKTANYWIKTANSLTNSQLFHSKITGMCLKAMIGLQSYDWFWILFFFKKHLTFVLSWNYYSFWKLFIFLKINFSGTSCFWVQTCIPLSYTEVFIRYR